MRPRQGNALIALEPFFYASQEIYAHLLTYGALQIEPTNSGFMQTSRQAPTAASSNSS